MIIGAHSIIYSKSPDADRAFLRDVVGLSGVDVGGGWLIFGLPPAELAVHPSGENDVHEFYLMCDDIEALVSHLRKKGVACDPVQNPGWGLLTRVTLPGGGKLGVYQPRHARPESPTGKAKKKRTVAAAKRRAKKKAPLKRKATPRKARRAPTRR